MTAPRPPRRTRCLTVGSSDSSGGAGIQGDLKAFASVGAYGATVLVGVTAQSPAGVIASAPVDLDLVAAQLDTVLADIGADGVKVGTTWSAALMHLVADRLAGIPAPLVVDPVLVTAAGSGLSGGQDAVDALCERLLPMAAVTTPNFAEARRLTGLTDETDPAVLAGALVRRGARAVVITDVPGGGDWLFDGRRHRAVPGPRHATGCEHGAGCAHSALLTAFLARGVPLPRAAELAHRAVAAGVANGAVDIGRDRHPVDLLTATAADTATDTETDTDTDTATATGAAAAVGAATATATETGAATATDTDAAAAVGAAVVGGDRGRPA
ncbi:bifunctional hydroxymethylpyrimidine kinase/phosphomethylpyrimidine kinase [Streptomyces hygroscopicus subsp. hygroscopicus]|uniref:Hydroxymethylpyrimidine/phosphomethylpyrimidine kinase n=1 Tax=Streptomyces hygroscopicus TaxID=1912 RepID=A0ABQ3U673_STRHY|nr:PfkB family carbohydrate kinase [Streptomyces hygroscopicus]MBW8090344.1 bifunctional hydroxymethylpyrimidine kinase/phosphomethylpyrimidine kinase [Streptomyces hygroscopicus subsp. hygroscopicus]GHJ31099.1 hydroxymethylpyrimidine/phosphomethylpyrimidine kinase [Streptomyces hygroscopicus]